MNDMISSLDDLCRLCAGKIDVLMGFNVFASDQRDLLKKINLCLPIDVSINDGFPKVICMDCAYKLDLMFEFRERCLLTAHLFEEMISTEDVHNIVLPGPSASNDSVLINTDPFTEATAIKQVEEKDKAHFQPVSLPIEEQLRTDVNSDELNTDDLISTDKTDCTEIENVSAEDKLDLLSRIKLKSDKREHKNCPECGKTCQSNYKLLEHMRRHTGEKPYHCSYTACKKSFRSKIGLAQHEANHTGQFEFSCTTCGKGFQCKSYLVVHQRVHSDDKPYPCDQCSRKFKTKQSLLDHKNRHLGFKPFLCDICGRGFITKGLCKSHQKVHSGTDNRQYPCHVCRKLFVSKSYLNTHFRIHTGEKPFMCEVCGKGFLTRVDLRIHSTMHTGEKPFVCETCGKAFARRDALRCHRRSHTGERPYKCDYCGQSFTQFSPMAIHKRLHTGERPYRCDVCPNAFVSRSTMLAHRRKHHDTTVSGADSQKMDDSDIKEEYLLSPSGREIKASDFPVRAPD